MNADSKTPPAPRSSSSSLVLYSSLGVIVMFVLLFVLNWLSNLTNSQADFTENKVHTLSEGTKGVLKDLKNSDVPVTVKLFVSPDEDIPTQNQNWLVMLRELKSRLEVFKGFAGKNLKIEIARPRTDTDDEDSAKQSGVNPQQVGNGENVFFGVAATCLDKTSTIPFVPAIDAPMMEYKLIRAISRVIPGSRKTVGLMSALELDGGQMAMMGGAPASFFYRELSEDYDVVKVDVASNEIKTNEYSEYSLDFAKSEFTRQETKNGTPGTKGTGTFTIPGADMKESGKAPEKIELTKYQVKEGGSVSELTFSGPSTGSQLTNGKTEGFAYTYTKGDDTHATIKVSKGIDVLVIVHPAGISDEAQWAVDQFILKGGKVLAMVDSYNIQAVESSRQQQNPMMMGGRPPTTPTFSNLDKLITSWGLTFDQTKSVADVNYAAPMFGNNPLIITPPSAAISKKSDITKGLNDFVFAFAGGFSGKAAFGLTEEILIESSKDNMLASTANMDRGQIEKIKRDFVSSDQKRMLAVKISGMFPTAFSAGKPDAPPPAPPKQPGMGGGMPFNFGGPQGDPGTPGAAAPAATPAAPTEAPTPAPAAPPTPAPAAPATPAPPAPAPAAPPTAVTPPVSAPVPGEAAAPAPIVPAAPPAGAPVAPGAPPAPPAPPVKPKVPSLAVAEKAGTVYLVADADLLYDPVSLERDRGPLAEPANSNIPFVMNIIDDLAGNGGMIQSRSRSSASRPFTKLNEILEQTNKGLRVEQAKVEEEIAKWKSEITAAAGKKQGNSPFIMVDQRQMDELNKKVEEGEAKKRELRKEFRKNIEGKFKTYQAWNILGVPVLTILLGFGIVLFMKSKTAAR
jgi:ABC-type uncharacterized transport system involved in gliding motility auxiliary subunit